MKKKYTFILLLLVLGIGFANAQFTNIYTFDTVPGAYPYGSVAVSGNKLFGVGYEGGKNGYGFVFSVNRDGSGFADLWDCNDTGTIAGNSNGEYPYGNLTIIGKKLYGFTYDGGANGYGLLFSLNQDGSGYKDLYDFSSASGGNLGWGSLQVAGNKFYGMTSYEGANGYGTIFSVDTNGKGYRDVWDFNDTGTIAGNSNGAEPEDVQLVVSGKKLYGMTEIGGANDSGEIFSVDTNGSGYKDMYDFNLANGYNPYGHLTMAGNKLFGMTYYGGTRDSGVIFSIDTSGYAYKVLVNLDSAKGCFPWGSLTYSRGELYGMNYLGGAYDTGNMFKVDTNGTTYMDLHDFKGPDGSEPYGNNLTLSKDTLFGMTWGGGVNGYGNIFYYVDTAVITGVNEVKENGTVKLYPNPNNGVFTIGLQNVNETAQVSIYNMLGEEVYAARYTNGTSTIDISSESDGVYLYRITDMNGNIIKADKLVIVR